MNPAAWKILPLLAAGLSFLAPIGPRAARTAAVPAPDRAPIRLGVCDWTIGKAGDPKALAAAGALDLEGVQLSLTVKDGSLALLDPELQRAYRDESRRTGVALVSLCLGDLNGIPLKSDPRAEAWLGQSVAVAKAMGLRIVLVPFFGNGELRNDAAGVDAVVAALRRAAPAAERAGVVFALENYLSAEENLDILRRVGSPAAAVYYDVGNSQQVGHDVGREIRLLGRRIAEVHAKDTKGLYGKGSMDFAAVRRAMDDVGYAGWFVLEGTEMPLGVERSLKADVDFLRTLFPRR